MNDRNVVEVVSVPASGSMLSIYTNGVGSKESDVGKIMWIADDSSEFRPTFF